LKPTHVIEMEPMLLGQVAIQVRVSNQRGLNNQNRGCIVTWKKAASKLHIGSGYNQLPANGKIGIMGYYCTMGLLALKVMLLPA
jgi:hypothetical protein